MVNLDRNKLRRRPKLCVMSICIIEISTEYTRNDVAHIDLGESSGLRPSLTSAEGPKLDKKIILLRILEHLHGVQK